MPFGGVKMNNLGENWENIGNKCLSLPEEGQDIRSLMCHNLEELLEKSHKFKNAVWVDFVSTFTIGCHKEEIELGRL